MSLISSIQLSNNTLRAQQIGLQVAGQNIANPTATFLALANLLRHLGEVDTGRALRRSTLAAIEAGTCTADIGGSLGTVEFTATVCAGLEKG